jgi:hypothetical protein
VGRVVDCPVMQRLELHSADGFLVIRIENQLENIDRLREVVLERTDWERLEGVPDRPATFSRTALYLIVVIGISAGFSGLGIIFALMGGLGGLLLIPMGLLTLLEWFTIRVDRTGVTFRHLLWKRKLPIEDIAEVSTSTLRPGHGNALSAVLLRLRNGKVWRITAVRGGVLGLYRALLAAVRSE